MFLILIFYTSLFCFGMEKQSDLLYAQKRYSFYLPKDQKVKTCSNALEKIPGPWICSLKREGSDFDRKMEGKYPWVLYLFKNIKELSNDYKMSFQSRRLKIKDAASFGKYIFRHFETLT